MSSEFAHKTDGITGVTPFEFRAISHQIVNLINQEKYRYYDSFFQFIKSYFIEFDFEHIPASLKALKEV